MPTRKREQVDELIATIPISAIPIAVKYGIAPAMAASLDTTYWGKQN